MHSKLSHLAIRRYLGCMIGRCRNFADATKSSNWRTMGIIRAARFLRSFGQNVRPNALLSGSVVTVDLFNFMFKIGHKEGFYTKSEEAQCYILTQHVSKINDWIQQHGGMPVFVMDGFFKPLKQSLLRHRRLMQRQSEQVIHMARISLGKSRKDQEISLTEMVASLGLKPLVKIEFSPEIDEEFKAKVHHIMQEKISDLPEESQIENLNILLSYYQNSETEDTTEANIEVRRHVRAAIKRHIPLKLLKRSKVIEAMDTVEKDEQKLEEAKKKAFRPTTTHYRAVKNQFRSDRSGKFAFIEAIGDAEAQCAHLARPEVGFANLVLSDDFDTLAFGAPFLATGLIDAMEGAPLRLYNLEQILKELELDYEQFVELCVICGCDYVHGVHLFEQLKFADHELYMVKQMVKSYDREKQIVTSNFPAREEAQDQVEKVLRSEVLNIAKRYFMNPEVHLLQFVDSPRPENTE